MIQAFKKTFSDETPFFMSLPALLWQGLFFFAPLAIVVVFSFSHFSAMDAWQGFTLNNYRILFATSFFRVMARSLVLALSVATASLLVAYPVAYFLARKVQRWKNVLVYLLLIPFWTNFLIQIYAWFFLLERNGIINSLLSKMGLIHEPLQLTYNMGAIFVVMFYCYFPFMLMPLYTALEKIDDRILEASFDLGANHWRTFWFITLPLSMRAVRNGFFLVLVPAFGEFVIPAVLGGAKYMFVGTLISHYALNVRNIALGAAFTCLSGCVLFAGTLVVWLIFKKMHA
jgi:spermidine/putrescine transport system permease protein